MIMLSNKSFVHCCNAPAKIPILPITDNTEIIMSLLPRLELSINGSVIVDDIIYGSTDEFSKDNKYGKILIM